MKRNIVFFLAAMATVMMTSTLACTHPWDTAHAALEVGAEAVTQTDAIVAAGIVEANTRMRDELVAQARADREAYEQCIVCMQNEGCTPAHECGERPTVDYYMGLLAERLESWEAAADSLNVMREVLLVAEEAVTAWRDLKTQPDNWGAVCQRLGNAQRSVVRAVESTGADVPRDWEGLLNGLEAVCTLTSLQLGGNS